MDFQILSYTVTYRKDQSVAVDPVPCALQALPCTDNNMRNNEMGSSKKTTITA